MIILNKAEKDLLSNYNKETSSSLAGGKK